MRRWLTVFLLLQFFLAGLPAGFSDDAPLQAKGQPPNIIFILADDLGWSELGCYGNRFHETPHIDVLAREGIRFQQAYASAPVCSPYRASLLTGQYPARHGILDYLRPDASRSLADSATTLPELLKTSGYATGMIGKWHLSGYRHHGAEFEQQPKDHGFDFQIGNEVKSVGNGANFWPYVFRDQKIRWINFPENRLGENEYLIDRMNLEAVDFIDRHQNQPFFLYLSHYATHTILNGKQTLVKKYTQKHPPGKSSRSRCYLCEDNGKGEGDPDHHWAADHNPHLAAMLESIDQGVGQITRKLKELGIDENTIIIFTSDNGGESNVTSNAPLSGGKSRLEEGGIRVPLVVRWPARIPAGHLSHQVTCNIDFLPTLLEATGTRSRPVQTVDGISILGNLTAPHRVNNRRSLFWHYPLDRPHFLGGTSAGALLKDGRWKMILSLDGHQVRLHDLADDPSEKKELADSHPGRLQKLRRELLEWRKAIGARIPAPPKMVEPTRLRLGETFTGGTISQRWHFTEGFLPHEGRLKRSTDDPEPKRVFVKKPEFKDSMIRFDFKLGRASEIRLMTGAQGGYNTVVHIRPDQFFIQTAVDRSVPFFPSYQGFCQLSLEPDSWYTMTVEFLEDQAIASVQTDGSTDRFAFARHPIINRTRTYLAFQASGGGQFDNFELHDARQARSWGTERQQELLRTQSERIRIAEEKRRSLPGTPASIKQEYDFRKANTMDRLYRSDAHYRELLAHIEAEKKRQQELYPQVFSTMKQVRKKIALEKKETRESDVRYNEQVKRINQAKKAATLWILDADPSIGLAPENQQKALIASALKKTENRPELQKLVQQLRAEEKQLEKMFPKLFPSDKQIQMRKTQARTELKNNPVFQSRLKSTAKAVHAAQDYLWEKDPRLKELFLKKK